MQKRQLQLILCVLLTISLIPALILAWQRIAFERNYNIVGLTIDYGDVVQQARENGLETSDLLKQYRALGVNGVSVYEPSLGRLVQNDLVLYREGAEWRNQRLSLRLDVSEIRSREYYLRSLKAGVAERFMTKYQYPTRQVQIDGQFWTAFPLNILALPAGPDLELQSDLEALGFFVVYRPFESGALRDPGADFPKVPFIVYAGDEVTGNSTDQKRQKILERTKNTITGMVESVKQDGLEDIIKVNPTVRVFAIPAAWQKRLVPEEAASKFILAARERNHRLLYLRPYERIDDTKTFFKAILAGLERADLKLGTPIALEFTQNSLLHRLSFFGALLGLALFATLFPWWWLGVATTLGVLGISMFFAGIGAKGLALSAALVFSVLGFALARAKLLDWAKATGITLMGAFFVSALGVSRNEVLAIEPFAGVGLLLVVPPVLLGLTMIPKQDIRKTIRDLWNTPVSLGFIALMAFAAGALAIIVLRRGNDTGVGITEAEAKARAAVQDSIIRPRSKELALHAPGLIGLSGLFPTWLNNILLMASSIGQASIIGSFAHFHTPLLISLLRTVNGIAIGGAIGFIVLGVVWFGNTYFRKWLEEQRLGLKD
ncbi:MAG: hypothetical protein RLZZ156_325 [Deinococcota bacterium]